MFIRFISKRSERGDTLVEVLVAISVVSLVLGGAFVLTNRSLQGTRASQERVNATKLIESQIEQLKNFASTNSDVIFGTSAPNPFCIDSSGTIRAASHSGCKVGVNGNPTAAEPMFTLQVMRSGNVFTVKNTWQDVRGTGTASAEMKYKIYED